MGEIEGTIHHDVPFGAMLNIETKQPAVVLEHFESVLNGVTCSPAGIYIAFNSEPQAGKVRNSWNGHEFIVITSHIGCNNDGERVPYLLVYSLIFFYVFANHNLESPILLLRHRVLCCMATLLAGVTLRRAWI